ncbi:MAG TPA: DEAD/DEAH box helicase [Blastocatellia bacterium]|nr:DEAD/DEAH box helicase [Blastocatellia bacterium]
MNLDNFHKLGLRPELVSVIERLGLSVPTDIQMKAIPPALAGQNVMATAETGSGKTAAFLLPIIERLERPGAARALVLAPTRELALQIEANARDFSRAARLRTVAVVGGENIARQMRALRTGVDIIIATPGRLNDLIERNAVRLGAIEALVLDEADRMLDMGFLPQVRRIIRHLPAKRQTMLFTATLSRAVELLARELLSDCVRVAAARTATTTATLKQTAFPVLAHAKTPLLLALLKQKTDGAILVFTQTRRGADRLAHILTANQHEVATLHSDRTQSQRNRALQSFRAGNVRVMVATDVAARGIDIDDIAYVINYEVPATAEDYIHRVGRTARAGREGAAFTLVSPEEEAMLASIERTTGVKLERERLQGFTDGRSEQQIQLASEIARLRAVSRRSFASGRAARR